MKRLLQILCLVFLAIQGSAQTLTVAIITPTNGQKIGGKAFDVQIHLTSDQPGYVENYVYFDGQLVSAGVTGSQDLTIDIGTLQTNVKGPHTLYAQAVTTYWVNGVQQWSTNRVQSATVTVYR